MNSAMGVAWLVLASIGLAGAAYLFRFEPMPSLGRDPLVWDRWQQSACIVFPTAGVVCTSADADRLSQSPGDLPSAAELLDPPPQ